MFYRKTFKENDVPHIYAISLLGIFDFVNVLSIIVYKNIQISKTIVIIILSLILITNYLTYKFTSPSSINVAWLNWSYFILTPIVFIITMHYLKD